MKTLQIRNVPDSVHRALKARAASEGRSLSEMALSELTRSLDRPTRSAILERLANRRAFDIAEGAAGLVRAEREAR